VDLLLRDEISGAELAEAIEIQARVTELRGIPEKRGLGLVQLNREWAWVDLREKVALLHVLPLAENDLVEPPVDLALHGYGRERQWFAESLEIDRHIVLDDSGDGDRNDPPLGGCSGRRARAGLGA